MMLGQYPVTWLVTELISIVLFILCLFHALRQEDAKHKVFELLCFIIGSGIFEHVGVLTGNYHYDQHRILMVGLVPLSVLMLEAVIMYASFTLFENLNMPEWTAIWVVGFWSSFQDMSIDPVYVHNSYSYNGILSGQWNWAPAAGGSMFGIPFFNYSGWLYMTGFYAALILLGRWLYRKYSNRAFGVLYPFLAGLLLIVPLMAVGNLLINFPLYRAAEPFLLTVNYAFPIVLMVVYRKRMYPINLKKDGIVFIVPIILRLYDITVAFGLGLTIAYVPVIVCSVLHFGYLFYLYGKSKKTRLEPMKSLNPSSYRADFKLLVKQRAPYDQQK